MIHEIEPEKYDPSFKNIPASDEDYALCYKKDQIFAFIEGGRVFLPRFKELKGLPESAGEYEEIKNNVYYLFDISGRKYFLAEPDLSSFPLSESREALFNDYGKSEARTFFLMNINKFRELMTKEEMFHDGSLGAAGSPSVPMIFAAATGGHMAWWKRSRSFCGFCGTKAVPSETERAMICPKCGNIEYPKISPAVITAIIKRGRVPSEDRILLVRNNYGSYRKLALVAGFVEIGESFEQAVHREIAEEVGLKVKNLKYYKNQPWGLSYSQMIGFTAELDGDDTIRLQESELSEGGWYLREEVPDNPFRLSVGNEMIHRFKCGEL